MQWYPGQINTMTACNFTAQNLMTGYNANNCSLYLQGFGSIVHCQGKYTKNQIINLLNILLLLYTKAQTPTFCAYPQNATSSCWVQFASFQTDNLIIFDITSTTIKLLFARPFVNTVKFWAPVFLSAKMIFIDAVSQMHDGLFHLLFIPIQWSRQS